MSKLCRLVCELGYVLRVTENKVDGTKDLSDQHGMSISQIKRLEKGKIRVSDSNMLANIRTYLTYVLSLTIRLLVE